MAKVAIVVGSKTDLPSMASCRKYLEHFNIAYEEKVMSAHRNPEQTAEFARQAQQQGYSVIIAAAGMAAHLAGTLAAHTVLPVIGVPMPGSHLNGMDALLSTVQMPTGIPVATMAIGSAGAANAAILAAQILALQDDALRQKLMTFKQQGARL